MNYSDYDNTNFRLAISKNKDGFLFIDRDYSNPNYVDYALDPMDHSLVNARLEEAPPSNEIVIILRCIKDVTAGQEILISFGMVIWATYFRSKWNSELMDDLLMEKAKEVYNIEDNFIETITMNDHICKTIANKIEEFDDWKPGVKYNLTHFISVRGSSFYNAVFQCLSHIPALTRLILGTDIFDDTINDNFPNNYLKQFVRQLLINNKVIEGVDEDPFLACQTIGELITNDQNLGLQFAENITNIEKFSQWHHFNEVVFHHLFGFYVDHKSYCMEKSHCCSYSRVHFSNLNLSFINPESSEVESLNRLIDNLLLNEQFTNYRCVHCSPTKSNSGKGTIKRSFHTYPKVLLIVLDRRVLNENDEVTSFNDKNVEYTRYLKVDEFHYQLIGVVVFDKIFISYFLHSDKKWYKDDGSVIKEVTAKIACTQPKAYFFVYKKYNDIQQIADIPEIVDLIVDSYGKTLDNQVAISLQFPIVSTRRGKPTYSCRNIIKQFENQRCDNISSFKKFIDDNKLKLHIWRYHDKKDKVNHDKMFNSCTNNGTSGYQLDFLLRERKTNNSDTLLKSKDKYMKDNHKIITPTKKTDFLYWLQVVTNPESKYYFTNMKRPKVNCINNNNYLNQYKTYLDWIVIRTKQHNKGEIDDNTYNEELAYYKIYAARQWLVKQPNLKDGEYPQYDCPGDGIQIPLWWDTSMFQYTNHDHDFSIFFNNEGVKDIPYIKNYYILQYTTVCNKIKYDYSISEGDKSIMDQNHGALDGDKYHLLTTYLFDNAIIEGLCVIYQNMNDILKYGENNYTYKLNRWGGVVDYTREYLPSKIIENIADTMVENIFSDIRTEICTSTLILKILETSKETKLNDADLNDRRNEDINTDKIMIVESHLVNDSLNNNNDSEGIETNKHSNLNAKIEDINSIHTDNTIVESLNTTTNKPISILKGKEIKKKIVDLVLPNLTNILQNHKNDKLRMHIIKKLTQYKKDKKIEIPNIKFSTNVANLFNLVEESDIKSLDKK